MKALLIADLHGSQQFLKTLESIIKSYEVILCAGDLTDFGRPEGYFEKLSDIVGDQPFYWASGNNDIGQSYQYQKSNLINIDGKVINFGNYKFAGLGGSAPNYEGQNYGPTLDSDTDLSDTILITHVPPSRPLHYQKDDITCHSVPPVRHPELLSRHPEPIRQAQGKLREGSGRTFKLNNAPLAHLCGHLHNIYGVACIGQTKVIKIGTAKQGQWAELDLDDLSVSFFS